DRGAAEAEILAVNVDVAARLLPITEHTVGGIWVIQPHGEMEQALGIEAIDLVKALRNLAIALPPLGPGAAGAGENRVAVHETERLMFGASPELDRGLLLE